MSNSFYKNRRLKALIFLALCFFAAAIPHFISIKNFHYLSFTLSFFIDCYGILVISRNKTRSNIAKNIEKKQTDDKLPILDILVAARDEENVIARLVERLFNLDYPTNKLNIYIIDDGSLIRP